MANNSTNVVLERLATRLPSLYDVDQDARLVVNDLFSEDATFEDPLMTVQGQSNIHAQFASLRKIFRNIAVDVHHVEYYHGGFSTHANVTYTFAVIPFRVDIRCMIICLVRDGKIYLHTEHWDVRSLISSIPLVGRLYNAVFRPSMGYLSSMAIKGLMAIRGGKPKILKRS
eukprot:GILJ01006825.1.p1 GENE.GILJ01006825.1~~GILJ01006825.1.p1  ORF type:complete len:184 (+),score=13.43 GILJ01006825.1:41-553(+)